MYKWNLPFPVHGGAVEPLDLQAHAALSARAQTAPLTDDDMRQVLHRWRPDRAYLGGRKFGAQRKRTREDVERDLSSRARVPVVGDARAANDHLQGKHLARTRTTRGEETHVAAPARDDVRERAAGVARLCAPEAHPRRADEHRLPAYGVHGRVLDATERARAEPRAHDDRGRERVVRAAAGEDARAPLDDLADVEQRPAQDAPAARAEPHEQVVEVDRDVDGDRRECDA